MATKTTSILIDDIDGSEATETVRFTIGDASYEIDLSTKHAAKLDKILSPYKARRSGRATGARKSASRGRRSATESAKTLFSSLDAGQKEAFRKWAKLPNARRIADARVQGWIDAGRPYGGREPAKKAAVKTAAAKKAPAKRAAARKLATRKSRVEAESA
jgi:hypothetical protein